MPTAEVHEEYGADGVVDPDAHFTGDCVEDAEAPEELDGTVRLET